MTIITGRGRGLREEKFNASQISFQEGRGYNGILFQGRRFEKVSDFFLKSK